MFLIEVLWLEIFNFLDFFSLNRIRSVSKEWNKIITKKHRRNFSIKIINNNDLSQDIQIEHKDFKQEYLFTMFSKNTRYPPDWWIQYSCETFTEFIEIINSRNLRNSGFLRQTINSESEEIGIYNGYLTISRAGKYPAKIELKIHQNEIEIIKLIYSLMMVLARTKDKL